MIVNGGRNSIRNNWAGDTATYPKSIQLGGGTTAPALGDTTLSGSATTSGSEITVDSYDKEAVGSVTIINTLGTTEGNSTHTEIALFDDTVGTGTDTLLARKLITGFTKTDSFVFSEEYKITWSNKT